MTKVELNLADDLAVRAQAAGLLEQTRLEELLSAELRRQAFARLRENVARIHAVPGEPMSLDEIAEEVRAVRRERREAEAKKDSGR